MVTATQLETAADRYAADLARDGLDELDLTGLEDVGVAVHLTRWAGAGGAPPFAGIGYGTTAAQARVGALGETVERAASWRSTLSARPRVATRGEVRAAGARALDPRELGVDAGHVVDDAPRPWLPARRLRDDVEVWVPVEHVVSTPGEAARLGVTDPLVTPVSNGLGAGGDRDQAVLHALLEVLQRDGNGLRFRALDAGRVVDVDDARLDPATAQVLAALRARGVEVQVKLAATDFGLPDVVVVGSAPGDDLVVATACGEAVHPDRDVAVRKAVCEFAAARIRKRWSHHAPADGPLREPDGSWEQEEPRVLAATVRWLTDPPPDWPDLLRHSVFRVEQHVPWAQVPTTPTDDLTTRQVLDLVVDRLAAEGFEPVVVDLADGADGVHAVKVVVPGLEVETVAYGRIGERNVRRLLDGGRDDLVRVGARPDGDGWARVVLNEQAEARLGGAAWLDRAALDAVAGDLLPLYREPGQHAAQAAIAAGWRP
ncbi:YcaO-like family protein [Angustibacter aerolatus]